MMGLLCRGTIMGSTVNSVLRIAPFVDPDTGAGLAPGIRILLFALQAPTEIRLSDLPHRQLPVE